MRVSRILPDFICATQVMLVIQLDLRNYPNNTAASSSLGPIYHYIIYNKSRHTSKSESCGSYIKNTAVDTSWKLGTFRLDIHSGGRR